jgi:hypothetical protein
MNRQSALVGAIAVVTAAAVAQNDQESSTAAQQPRTPIHISELKESHDIIGSLGHPLGKVITVQGLIMSPPRKGDGPRAIRVHRIEGIATQEDLWLPLSSFRFELGRE